MRAGSGAVAGPVVGAAEVGDKYERIGSGGRQENFPHHFFAKYPNATQSLTVGVRNTTALYCITNSPVPFMCCISKGLLQKTYSIFEFLIYP